MGAKEGPKAPMGEMRRRHEAIMRSGAMTRVRSEGRLVFAFGLMYADYETCKFTMSARGGAKVCMCQPTTFRRGIAQLQAAGVLSRGPAAKNGRHWYRFVVPTNGGAHERCAGARTSGDRGAHEPCAGARTSGARGAHEPCAGARTSGAPYSSMFLKDSSRVLEGVPQDSAAAAQGAAAAKAAKETT
jgi:hypothetical protein